MERSDSLTIPDITAEKISELVTKCIHDLDDDTNELMELAAVFHSIAACSDKPYLFLFPYSIGGFAGSLSHAKSLTSIPILTGDVRKKHLATIATATAKAKEALKEIKTQCTDDVDYEKLLNATGTLFEQSRILSIQIDQYDRSNFNPQQ